MRITGFDKTNMDNAMKDSVIEKIKAVSCPKCHKNATNISIENNKLRFETCCGELRKIILDKIEKSSL